VSLEKAPSNNLGLTFQENVFKMSRYNEDEIKCIILNLAMNRLARDEEFRSGFLGVMTMIETSLFSKGRTLTDWGEIGMKRWRAFCAVAPAMLERGEMMWRAFKAAHLAKFDNDGEAMMLIAVWCEQYDPNEALETFAEMVEKGEMDEEQYVRQCDIAKVVHSVKERNAVLRGEA
jgi:hypothetical protein